MKLRTMKKRARARESFTRIFGWMFQGENGGDIQKAVQRGLYGRYRSRRPVKLDARPVPLLQCKHGHFASFRGDGTFANSDLWIVCDKGCSKNKYHGKYFSR